MTYVIVEACIGIKDRACVDVCPVDCIYEGEDQLYIHPDECIDCGACEPECPVTAIFPEEDVPPNMTSFVEKNREVFNSDAPIYGGSGQGNLGGVEGVPYPWNGRPSSVVVTLPPLSVIILARG